MKTILQVADYKYKLSEQTHQLYYGTYSLNTIKTLEIYS